MTIDVTGVNTWNKGAELMLVAIEQHIRQHHPSLLLAVEPWFGPFADRARYGLLLQPELHRFSRAKLALSLMPPSLRRALGVVMPAEVDAILDASGFAFGDQHPEKRAAGFAKRLARARSQGKPIVLLPQALGPFEQSNTRDAFRQIVDAADLVFARDPVSLEHAQGAVGAVDKLRMAPDFTNLVKPVLHRESDDSEEVTIVPNQRMIEKALTRADAEAYIPFLATCIRTVEAASLKPRLLIHGEHDAALCGDIRSAIGHDLTVIHETDPVAIKRALGESHVVIGSRFHALVSGLSQEVPCIATSWSHKYEMLFQDYGCEQMVLSVHADEDAVRDRLEQAVGPQRGALRKTLRKRGTALRQQTHDMWCSVEAALGLESHTPPREETTQGQTRVALMADCMQGS